MMSSDSLTQHVRATGRRCGLWCGACGAFGLHAADHRTNRTTTRTRTTARRWLLIWKALSEIHVGEVFPPIPESRGQEHRYILESFESCEVVEEGGSRISTGRYSTKLRELRVAWAGWERRGKHRKFPQPPLPLTTAHRDRHLSLYKHKAVQLCGAGTADGPKPKTV